MIRKIFLLLVFLMLCGQASYSRTQDIYNAVSKFANESDSCLLKKSIDYMSRDNMQDSAYICLSIITERHDELNDDKESLQTLAEAYLLIWELNLYYYSDYSEMFTALYKAMNIYQEQKKDLSRIYLNFGVLYQTLSEQYGIPTFQQKALDYYNKALNNATSSQNRIVADIAFGNSLSMLYDTGRFNKAANLYSQYKRHESKDSSTAAIFNREYYKFLTALYQNSLTKAISLGKNLVELVDKDPAYSRYTYMILQRMAEIYNRMGDYENASKCMQNCLTILENDNSGDLRVDWLKNMSELKEAQGLTQEAIDFSRRYVSAKDSLLNVRKMVEIDDMRFTSRIKDINREMEKIRFKNRINTIMLWCGGIILITVIIFSFTIWRKNKQLRMRNNVIWRNTYNDYPNNPETQQTQSSEVAEPVEMSKIEVKTSEPDESLVEKNKEIMAKVISVLQTSPEVYSTEFSSDTLARLTGINYKYISRAINDTYGTNFNYLLGEYRIREACRRINHQEGYLKLTVESMANDVGFKSRTTFTTSFKRVMGMMPSEYIKTAKQNIFSFKRTSGTEQ